MTGNSWIRITCLCIKLARARFSLDHKNVDHISWPNTFDPKLQTSSEISWSAQASFERLDSQIVANGCRNPSQLYQPECKLQPSRLDEADGGQSGFPTRASLGRIDMPVVNGSLRSSSSNSQGVYVCDLPNRRPAGKKSIKTQLRNQFPSVNCWFEKRINFEMLKRQNLVGERVTIQIIV